MSQPKSLIGAQAPLFEKLIDLNPNSAEDTQDLFFQDRSAIAASISREIGRILDTRLPWDGREEGQPVALSTEGEESVDPVDRRTTVMGYGVPDMTHLCVRSFFDRRAIEKLITDAISVFEPRLIDPVVTLSQPNSQQALGVEISGRFRVGRSLEPLIFRHDVGLQVSTTGRRELIKS